MRYSAIAVLFFLMSCTPKSCSNNAVTPEESKAKTWASPADFPMLDFTGLSNHDHTNRLIKIFNDEICPCGCPTSFAACLTMKNGGCTPAILLADWAIQQLKAGHPERFVIQGLTEEINAGFLVPPIKIDTMGAYHKGDSFAPITIVEFADFECHACRRTSHVLSDLIKAHGGIELYFMHAPVALDSRAEQAALAAEAAGLQGKFWAMHDALFSHALHETTIESIAQTIFNDAQLAQFRHDLTRAELKEKIRRQRDYAIKNLHLVSTPSLFINGRPYTLSLDEQGLSVRIAMERARSSINCQDY